MNLVALTGRLADEPDRRDTTNGVVCSFRLAVDGKPRLWITIDTWGRLAGTCAQHLHNGRRVAVTGALVHDQYVTRTGDRADRWYVRANDITFLDPPAVAAANGADADRVKVRS